jgi:flagellar L-ring protein FlgH
VLPKGNLVVEGAQELRINFEVRELILPGIVRPEDIQSDNTIDSAKVTAMMKLKSPSKDAGARVR